MGVGGGGGGVLSRLYEIMSYYKIPQETETDALINSLGTKKRSSPGGTKHSSFTQTLELSSDSSSVPQTAGIEVAIKRNLS